MILVHKGFLLPQRVCLSRPIKFQLVPLYISVIQKFRKKVPPAPIATAWSGSTSEFNFSPNFSRNNCLTRGRRDEPPIRTISSTISAENSGIFLMACSTTYVWVRNFSENSLGKIQRKFWLCWRGPLTCRKDLGSFLRNFLLSIFLCKCSLQISPAIFSEFSHLKNRFFKSDIISFSFGKRVLIWYKNYELLTSNLTEVELLSSIFVLRFFNKNIEKIVTLQRCSHLSTSALTACWKILSPYSFSNFSFPACSVILFWKYCIILWLKSSPPRCLSPFYLSKFCSIKMRKIWISNINSKFRSWKMIKP